MTTALEVLEDVAVLTVQEASAKNLTEWLEMPDSIAKKTIRGKD